MDDLRKRLVISGLVGLGGWLAVVLPTAYAVGAGMWPGLGWGWAAWLAYTFLAVVALVEMPIMVVGLRRMAAEGSGRLLVVVNATYVFFPAVYGLSLVLATGTLPAGLSICALSPLRLLSSLLFVGRD